MTAPTDDFASTDLGPEWTPVLGYGSFEFPRAPLELIEGFPAPPEVMAAITEGCVVRCKVVGGDASWEVIGPNGTIAFPTAGAEHE